MDHKLVVAVRADLDLSRGKLAVQVAHASVMAALDAKARHRRWFAAWYAEGQKKVVVRASGIPELHGLRARARGRGLPPGTVTCLAVGPGPNELVDQVTGSLKLV